jgi:hypothetical protein
VTPKEFIQHCAERGIALRLSGDKVLARGLNGEQRRYLRENVKAVGAVLAIAEVRRLDAERAKRQQREQQTELDRRQAREKERRFVEWLASLDEGRVEALAARGKLSAEEVLLWRELRDAVERMIVHHYSALQIAAGLSQISGRRVQVQFK